MSQTRRLAAILAADVAGYSPLIGAGKGSALDTVGAIRADLFDPGIGMRQGRVIPLRVRLTSPLAGSHDG